MLYSSITFASCGGIAVAKGWSDDMDRYSNISECGSEYSWVSWPSLNGVMFRSWSWILIVWIFVFWLWDIEINMERMSQGRISVTSPSFVDISTCNPYYASKPSFPASIAGIVKVCRQSRKTFLFLFCFFFFLLLFFFIFLYSYLRLPISPLFLNQSRWNLACW